MISTYQLKLINIIRITICIILISNYMKIIGLMGVKGSGKSTGSDYLISNYQYKEVAFADPLKKACQALFLFTDEQLYGTQEEKERADPRWFNCSPRTVMQFI